MYSILCSLYRQHRITDAQLGAYVTAGAITSEQAAYIIASGGNCGVWSADAAQAQAAVEAQAEVDPEAADHIAATAGDVEAETAAQGDVTPEA